MFSPRVAKRHPKHPIAVTYIFAEAVLEVMGFIDDEQIDLRTLDGADQSTAFDFSRRAFGNESREIAKRCDTVLLQHVLAFTTEMAVGADHSVPRVTYKGKLEQSGEGGRWIGPGARILAATLISPFVKQRLRAFVENLEPEHLDVLTDLVEAGQLTPVIDRTYPLEHAAAALLHVKDGHTRGKTVITVADPRRTPDGTTSR